jgi:glycosyltransferase involved in cell wall biosynthesis
MFENACHAQENPRALILASVASMIDQFNMENIKLLLRLGFEVDVAANFVDGGTITAERVLDLKRRLSDLGVTVYHVPVPRKISDVKGILSAYRQVKKLCEEKKYRIVHCHSPIGGVVCRLAAKGSRKYGTKVIYTAHGFHFYRGAPKINWMLFYPMEKLCSYFTDLLITINQEDYQLAQKKMKAKQVAYIPGIGVDTKKIALSGADAQKKREELGVQDSDVMLLSVGELNQNKNHQVVIQALAKLNADNIQYFIAGKGEEESELRGLAENSGVNLHLLGYRTDIDELLCAADLFVFPSFREGLSVSLMEAMAAGLPCVASEIRGNTDLIEDSINGYVCSPDNAEQFADRIADLVGDKETRALMGKHNKEKILNFDICKVTESMEKFYSACM